MGRYNPNPTAATVSIPVFPKGDYEFTLKEPKPFERTNQEGKTSHGVRYALDCTAVVEGDKNMKGKRTIFSCYQHNEGAVSFAKQFQMAVYGFDRSEHGETGFNDLALTKDWSYDPEAGAVGDGWKGMTGKRVVISMDVGVNPVSGEPNQNFTGFAPVK